MKNLRKTILYLLLIAPMTLAAAVSFANAATSIDKRTEARIKRIENGLVPPLVTQATTQMRIEDRMKHFKVPGVSIAVIENGKIAWARGYGVRDLNTNTPVDAETVFQAASISKPVSTVAMLQYVEAGKLNLDEDINQKLMSWHVPENAFTVKEKVTLRRIVTHRAGLTASGFPGYAVGEPIPSVVQILDGIKPAKTEAVRVDVVPQSRTRYSGGGFTVMQQLMLDVGGKPFPQQLDEMVLQPLGMTRSAFIQPLAGPLAANASSAHDDGKVVAGKFHIYPELAAAGLWTTPTDLARFAIEIQRAAAGKSSRVLTQKMAKQMLTLQSGFWGLGIMLEGTASQQRFLHSGSNEGFNCLMLAFKDTGAGVVVMTNANAGRSIIQEIVRAVANEYGWKAYAAPRRTVTELPAKSLQQYIGYYQLPAGNKVRVRIDNGKLIANTASGWSPLLARSPTTFFLADDGVQINFAKTPNGDIGSLTVVEDGAKSAPYRRVAEPAAPVESTAFYLRGSMNDWNTSNQMLVSGKNRYRTTVPLKPGRYEFKLGSEDFNAIDLGGSPAFQDVAVGTAKTLLPTGRNLRLNIEREGVYEFVLDATKPLELELIVSLRG